MKWHKFCSGPQAISLKILDFKICFLNPILICICFFLSIILHAQSVFSYYCFQRLKKQQNYHTWLPWLSLVPLCFFYNAFIISK